jgi:hypothetical protein
LLFNITLLLLPILFPLMLVFTIIFIIPRTLYHFYTLSHTPPHQ